METIGATRREIFGKKVAKLRQKGNLPAVLYGKGNKSQPLFVKSNEFLKLWKNAGESTVIELKVNDNGTFNVLIQDIAVDPIKNDPIHVDFLAIDMKKKVKVEVPLEFIGESEAVKGGGILVKVLHDLHIEALPKDLPHNLKVDLSLLRLVGDSILIRNIEAPSGVEIIDSLDETIVKVEEPRTEEVIAAPAEEKTIEDIEVIKKPKAEEVLEGKEGGEEENKK